ncbi:GNAT family N-acetyltransferase [Cohnella lubricantis]|uniref:GNAT family N-acetyltransferase n=1 Tax=Cohnella lubricantis TaxID=2163172 RepID=A0A841TE22_9BACL|nr:GNAT family N-acetyltransferase [Cohnella lubricantis]MBB6679282.1 GNAT family N-acetyltransferase [Cohnella lubricantis]MBP2119612.1 putative acetyltransferase [Cohnella lubricantis]
MLIRQLTKEEFDARKELSEFAFQFQFTPERLQEERERFQPGNYWGVFDEQGRMLSGLNLIPFEIYVQGRVLRMGGLAAVASWPETRRGGNITKLLERTLEAMREQGQTVSMLAPFQFPFYRKYGWEFTIERKRYEIEMALLPKSRESRGSMERVPKEAQELVAIYQAFASRYNGTLHRSEDWWSRKVLRKPGLAAVWRNDSGVPAGYIIYEVQNRLFTVHDWAYADEEARAEIWRFIANHDSMAERVSITVPADDALGFLLPDPRFKQELVPYFMSRVVDVEGFIEQYPFHPAEKEEGLTLDISDSYAPWNNRRFRIIFRADGAARVQQSAQSADRESGERLGNEELPAASCDIRALTAMLLGNRRPQWLRQAGLIQGDREALELLESRIPVRTSYLADFF